MSEKYIDIGGVPTDEKTYPFYIDNALRHKKNTYIVLDNRNPDFSLQYPNNLLFVQIDTFRPIELPFASASFDGGRMDLIFDWIHPSFDTMIVAEATRILKPESHLMITDFVQNAQRIMQAIEGVGCRACSQYSNEQLVHNMSDLSLQTKAMLYQQYEIIRFIITQHE